MGRPVPETAARWIGWIGSALLTARLWPQLILNHRRKSVSGLSVTLVIWNLLAAILDSIFYVGLYFSVGTAEEYQEKFDQRVKPATVRELIWACHHMLASVLLTLQLVFLHREPGQHITYVCGLVSTITSVANVIMYFANVFLCSGARCMLGFFEFLSASGVLLSFLRPFPQLLLNHSRKSTEGFSTGYAFLSFAGSFLCLLGMSIRCVVDESWREFTSQPGLTLLYLTELLLGLAFLTQAFFLYPRKRRHVARIPIPTDGYVALEDEEEGSVSSCASQSSRTAAALPKP